MGCVKGITFHKEAKFHFWHAKHIQIRIQTNIRSMLTITKIFNIQKWLWKNITNANFTATCVHIIRKIFIKFSISEMLKTFNWVMWHDLHLRQDSLCKAICLQVVICYFSAMFCIPSWLPQFLVHSRHLLLYRIIMRPTLAILSSSWLVRLTSWSEETGRRSGGRLALFWRMTARAIHCLQLGVTLNPTLDGLGYLFGVGAVNEGPTTSHGSQQVRLYLWRYRQRRPSSVFVGWPLRLWWTVCRLQWRWSCGTEGRR